MSTRLKKVCIILNPASGPDFPVLAYLNRALRKYEIDWELTVTKKKHDAAKLAEQALASRPDAIVVCGGDGTIAEVATQTYTTQTPLVLIPGGTANIFVKELGIPLDIPTAIEQLGKPLSVKKLDVAVVNNRFPLFLRVEVGMGAEIVTATKRKQKDAFGPFAYPLTALQKLGAATPAEYEVVVDGVTKRTQGVSLMIANIGNIGIAGVSIQPNVSCSDGLLDVFIIQSSDWASLVSISTSALIGTQKPPVLKHWKAKELTVKMSPTQAILSDDQLIDEQELHVKVADQKLKILL